MRPLTFLAALPFLIGVSSAEDLPETSPEPTAIVAEVEVPEAQAPPTGERSPETSVLRVNVTSQSYNFRLPWQKTSPRSKRALGALVAGNRVLVTADLVADATYLEIEKPTSGEKITAKVEGVDYEANLALVAPAVAAGEFFDDLIPMALETEASIGDELAVWHFETNGNPLTTELTLENYDMGNYFLSGSYFLTYEASGTIAYRDGSYTFPVAKDGKLAGILIDYSSSDELSTIIPTTIIEHFLTDLASPPYRGFPNFGIRYASTLDSQLRSFAKMGDRTGGIFISGVVPGTSAAKAGVKEGDVITKIAGYDIDPRGNYEDPTYGTLSISHLVKGGVFAGDTIPVSLLREGEEIDLQVKLIRKEPGDYLVRPYSFDRAPRYLLLGGMLFQELSQDYLESYGDKWRTRAPFKLVYAASHQDHYEEEGRDKLVFVSGTLPTQSTLGYESLAGTIVNKVNGKDIGSLEDLDAAVATPPENGIHRIEFSEFPHQLFISEESAEKDEAEVLTQRFRIEKLKHLN